MWSSVSSTNKEVGSSSSRDLLQIMCHQHQLQPNLQTLSLRCSLLLGRVELLALLLQLRSPQKSECSFSFCIFSRWWSKYLNVFFPHIFSSLLDLDPLSSSGPAAPSAAPTSWGGESLWFSLSLNILEISKNKVFTFLPLSFSFFIRSSWIRWVFQFFPLLPASSFDQCNLKTPPTPCRLDFCFSSYFKKHLCRWSMKMAW